MHNYSYRVAWSDEDTCYIATSPEFPNLSGFGDTAQQALEELTIALEASLEVYKAEGWKLPEPQKVQEYSGQFRLRLPKSLHARLVERAEFEGVSLNTLAVQYLTARLEESVDRSWIEQELHRIVNLAVCQAVGDYVYIAPTNHKGASYKSYQAENQQFVTQEFIKFVSSKSRAGQNKSGL